MPTIEDIAIGNTISFQSKSANDNNFYHGKVAGMATSDIAITYGDVLTYNSSVQSADMDVPEIDSQTFLIIKLIEPIDNSTKYVIPFSVDWINLPTLKIHSVNKTTSFRVYEVDSSNSQDIINLLKAAGFKARVLAYE